VAEILVVGKNFPKLRKSPSTTLEIHAEIEAMVETSSGDKEELRKALESQRNHDL